MTAVGIIDAGIGNVGSVANMCRRVGAAPSIITDPADLIGATCLILPGVGAWDHASARLHESGMAEALGQRVAAGVPLLGVCLGMQLLLERSEEGTLPGLGWIPGEVRRLPSDTARGAVRIPHMAWAALQTVRPHPLFDDLGDDARYYFVHSYAASPTDPEAIVATAEYGEPFVAVVARDNVIGTQFHPEKSHRHGKAILSNFLQHAPRPARAL